MRRRGWLRYRRCFSVSVGISGRIGFGLSRKYSEGILGWPGRQFPNTRNFPFFRFAEDMRLFIGDEGLEFFVAIFSQVGYTLGFV